MYASYFGLQQEPFSIAPDPHYLFMSERHREALAHLLYGLGQRGGAGVSASGAGGGFVLLSGEIGTGKTTVCRCFLEQIPAHCNVAYILNPKLTVIELLQSICEEFHVKMPRQETMPTVKNYLDPLNNFLLDAHATGRNNVLIIDEAQNLSAKVLEQLRLLTNLETSERKLLQIILIGQPELRTMLLRPELEQLAQRVIARYHLGPLTESETARYIQHRLEVAGLDRAQPFERNALARIHQLSRGVPRRINLLCDRALLGAFATSRATVSRAIVDQAAREVFGAAEPVTASWRRNLALLGLGLVAGAGLVAAARLGIRPDPSAGVVAQPPVMAAAAPATASASATGTATAPLAALASSAPAAAASGLSAALPVPAASPAPSPAASMAAVPPAAPASAGPAARPAPPVLLRSEDEAWRELALAWSAAPGEGRPCPALVREQVLCFSQVTSLALIRQLARPGVLVLDAASSAPSYALLTGLTAGSATLRAGGTEQTVTLAALAARWQGDFSTLWRAPAGYSARLGENQPTPVIEWVGRQLATAAGGTPPAGAARPDAALRTRLRTFQVAQGLPPDGRLGPVTFMQLNRVAGVDEPRLRTEP